MNVERSVEELSRELAALKGRVRRLEQDKKRMERLFTAALKQLGDLQQEPWEPVDFELSSSRNKRLEKRRKKK